METIFDIRGEVKTYLEEVFFKSDEFKEMVLEAAKKVIEQNVEVKE